MKDFTPKVPAYNEGEHIYGNLKIIDEALKAFCSDYEIIAVNDGSKDNTGEEIARAAADFPAIKDFGYDVNRGKGGAVSWGAVNSKGDVVGFIDADLDLSPSLIPGYVEAYVYAGADVVIGSKMHKDSKLEYPFKRKVVSFCYFIMLKVLFGLKCHDTQTGLKLYNGDLIRVGVPMLFTGNSYDILGKGITASDGTFIEGLGIFGYTFKEQLEKRYTGDVILEGYPGVL